VSEVAQEPPEPDRPALARLVIGEDERVAADAGPAGGSLEIGGLGQRVPAAVARLGGKIPVHVEEGRARDVALPPRALPRARLSEAEAAVDHD
jgi:hypothetical protein